MAEKLDNDIYAIQSKEPIYWGELCESSYATSSLCYQNIGKGQLKTCYNKIKAYEANGGRDSITGEYKDYYEKDGLYVVSLKTSAPPSFNSIAEAAKNKGDITNFYYEGLRSAAHSTSSKYVWFGDIYKLTDAANYRLCNYAYVVDYYGDIDSKETTGIDANNNAGIAPAFNLDIGKVDIDENGKVTAKKS